MAMASGPCILKEAWSSLGLASGGRYNNRGDVGGGGRGVVRVNEGGENLEVECSSSVMG